MTPPQILSSPSVDSVRSTTTSFGLPVSRATKAARPTSASPSPAPLMAQTLPGQGELIEALPAFRYILVATDRHAEAAVRLYGNFRPGTTRRGAARGGH